jgi:hypothetical protein
VRRNADALLVISNAYLDRLALPEPEGKEAA